VLKESYTFLRRRPNPLTRNPSSRRAPHPQLLGIAEDSLDSSTAPENTILSFRKTYNNFGLLHSKFKLRPPGLPAIQCPPRREAAAVPEDQEPLETALSQVSQAWSVLALSLHKAWKENIHHGRAVQCVLHFTLKVEQNCTELHRQIALGGATEERRAAVTVYVGECVSLLAQITSNLCLSDELKRRMLSTFLSLMNLRDKIARPASYPEPRSARPSVVPARVVAAS
jgi:hypothetical protein